GFESRRGHHLFYFMDIGRISSAGRALALQARGRRFEPCILHHVEKTSYREAEHVFTCEETIDDETDKRYTVRYGAGIQFYSYCISRGGAVWPLVGLITQRSQVQILPPQPIIIRMKLSMFIFI